MNAKSEVFLVTGALGCIGAWTIRTLVREGVSAVAFDLGADVQRLRLIMTPDELDKVVFIRGDVTSLGALIRTIEEYSVTNVVHLAALQVPFVRADPILGAKVNVAGTMALFEAVKACRNRVRGLAYASSIAVYGEHDSGDEDARGHPATFYGVFKQANEGAARVYWQDDQIPSIGLRPSVIYGAGRDQGMTSGPTVAMRAAATGARFHIPFGGRTQFDYVEDVARAFITASRRVRDGADIFNIPGKPTHMKAMVEAIIAAAPEAEGKVTFDDSVGLPFPADLEAVGSEKTLGALPMTSLSEAVRTTVELFRQAPPTSAQPQA